MGRLQTARLENFVRRWGSIKGPGSVLSETLGDVFPVLDLENLTPENLLPAGWSPIVGFATVVGVAAQLPGMQATNAVGSGMLAVVDKIIVNSELGGSHTFGTTAGGMTQVTGFSNRDTRSASALNAGLRVRANANATAQTHGIFDTVAGVDRELEVPHGLAVLAPGDSFSVVGSTVNSDMTVTFFAHVRLAEPSELSF